MKISSVLILIGALACSLQSMAYSSCPHPKQMRMSSVPVNWICEPLWSADDYQPYPRKMIINEITGDKVDQFGNLLCIYPVGGPAEGFFFQLGIVNEQTNKLIEYNCHSEQYFRLDGNDFVAVGQTTKFSNKDIPYPSYEYVHFKFSQTK